MAATDGQHSENNVDASGEDKACMTYEILTATDQENKKKKQET
jgi:hypothetical protein